MRRADLEQNVDYAHSPYVSPDTRTSAERVTVVDLGHWGSDPIWGEPKEHLLATGEKVVGRFFPKDKALEVLVRRARDGKVLAVKPRNLICTWADQEVYLAAKDEDVRRREDALRVAREQVRALEAAHPGVVGRVSRDNRMSSSFEVSFSISDFETFIADYERKGEP